MEKLKILSLFSGCGGMDVGITGGFKFLGQEYHPHNTKIVGAFDHDEKIVEVYNKNFPHTCTHADIRNISNEVFPQHDILLGGFPCQSFSIIAQNPPRLGYVDEKGKLFFEMCRVLEDKRPACFIAENVKGILSANKKRAFPVILKHFEKVGYHIQYKLLNSSDFGIPQKRERVFIIGFLDRNHYDNFLFPEKVVNNPIPLSSVVIPEENIENKYYFSQKAIDGMLRVQTKMNKGRSQELSEPCNTVGAHLAKASLNSTDPVLNINGKYRRFTPREVARIQSFPDTYKLGDFDTHNYRALGNAVPPVMMWHITKSVIKALSCKNEESNAA